MGSLDSYIHGLSPQGAVPIWLTLVIAALLGLRHASDPDHLSAVSALVAHDRLTTWGAMRVGASWGFGHATSCLLFGIPVLLFTTKLPSVVYQTAEAAVGCIIIYFSCKLAYQILTGEFHFHGHRHPHGHGAVPSRSHLKSYGIGLLHGLGGSYGAAVLLLSSFHNAHQAVIGLVLFAAFATVSMTLTTGLFAYTITHHRLMHVMPFVLALLAAISLCFGVAYLYEAVS